MPKKKYIDPVRVSASKKAASEYLANFEWLIGIIAENKGKLRIPKLAVEFYSNTDHQPWSEFYEHPLKLSLLPFFIFYQPADVVNFINEYKTLSEEEVLKEFNETDFSIDDVIEESVLTLFDDKLPTKKEVRDYIASTTECERQNDINNFYLFWSAILLQLYDFISLCTFGSTLCELVDSAKKGDRTAFLQAVQIDKTVLFGIPYFRRVLARLQLGAEPALLIELSRSMTKNHLQGDLGHPGVYIVFSILEKFKVLKDMPLDQLLDICLELSVYSSDDTNAISKLKNRFYSKRKRTS